MGDDAKKLSGMILNLEQESKPEIVVSATISLIRDNGRVFPIVSVSKESEIDLYVLYGMFCSFKLELENRIREIENKPINN